MSMGYIEDSSCLKVNVCPDLLISLITSAAAAAFFMLYQAITMAAGMRKKRSLEGAGGPLRFLLWLGSGRPRH